MARRNFAKKNEEKLWSFNFFSNTHLQISKTGFSWVGRIQKYPIYHCFTLLLHHYPSIRALSNLGNTALHYAKPYPDQSVAQFLLNHGAKIDINHQKNININPRTLEQYFYDYCIIPEGDDIDDEDFKIRIKFKLFEKPVYGGSRFWFTYLLNVSFFGHPFVYIVY